jgi:hypothetical protein
MGKENAICCKCKEPISGFVAHTDRAGQWCEDCLNLFTCEDCGSVESEILDGGLCASCEADHGE